ncbi:MAG: hypothetical protein K6U03_04445 [Firmicutes bacterium]|nr:hypothetical protein [Bacillota bacterium]
MIKITTLFSPTPFMTAIPERTRARLTAWRKRIASPRKRWERPGRRGASNRLYGLAAVNFLRSCRQILLITSRPSWAAGRLPFALLPTDSLNGLYILHLRPEVVWGGHIDRRTLFPPTPLTTGRWIGIMITVLNDWPVNLRGEDG